VMARQAPAQAVQVAVQCSVHSSLFLDDVLASGFIFSDGTPVSHKFGHWNGNNRCRGWRRWQ
jgi:hypothetical protein